jgi:hypothetical protein
VKPPHTTHINSLRSAVGAEEPAKFAYRVK